MNKEASRKELGDTVDEGFLWKTRLELQVYRLDTCKQGEVRGFYGGDECLSHQLVPSGNSGQAVTLRDK